MPGIGDQTPHNTKGLKVLSSNVTIGTLPSSLNPHFVNICEPSNKKNPGTIGEHSRGYNLFGKGLFRTKYSQIPGSVKKDSIQNLHK